MPITNGRSEERVNWERQLERLCPIRKKLIRANPYTCTECFINGRETVRVTCSTCGGTGYEGGVRGADLNSGAPYSTIYLIFMDIQPGHGLYGSGGDLIRVLADLGKLENGDGLLYTKIVDFDRVSGKAVYPTVDPSLARPDVVEDLDGQYYNVVRDLRGNVGDRDIYRMFSLQKGGYVK